MKKVYLSGIHGKNKFCLVDNDDFDRVSIYSWSFHPISGYAQRSYKKNKRSVTQSMHRFIMNETSKFQIDHINNNKLDNRKSNLRRCTASQNLQNRKGSKGKSKYKGVYHCKNAKRVKKYQAYITKNKKRKTIGWFLTEEEAAKAYNLYAKKKFKQFASLNRVKENQP